MYFLNKRIKVICEELKKMVLKQSIPIENWLYKEGDFIAPADADANNTPYQKFDSDKMHWYGPDRHYWFKKDYQVQAEMHGKPFWLNIRTQVDGWNSRNPQFLIFINGQAVQGLDTNHHEVLVAENAKQGDVYRFDLQSYTGTEVDELRFIACAQELDPQINALYYDLCVPLDAFPRMKDESKEKLTLERELNNTINLLDLRTPYSKDFYTSLQKAQEYISKAIYTDLAGNDEIIASCIGHTHIDVAWWWTVAQTKEKVGRSFSTVLKLMEEYPNYQFMSSQPQLYQFIKERYPELYEKIKQRIEEGRWEAEGGMWVEADCNLTSGESLVRQFIHGKKFFKEEFGLDNRILWLPDVFGYSGALPQIMRKSGIDYFMTTKLAWNQVNKIPHDTLMWRGIDGSEVLTHLITTLDIGQSVENFFTTYNGMLHPDAIMGGWERYQDKNINNDMLISYGHGDGGGGPTREMLETSIRMEKGILGIPKVRQVFSRTYFEELSERVKDNNRLATWEGEFYFEYHRGVYTSMARNKRSNRKSEIGMMDLELFSVIADKKLPYAAKEFDIMWKSILINQFHDILPGTSIEEVYEVTKKEYAQLKEKIDSMSAERIGLIAGSGTGFTVVNTTGYQRNDIIELGDCAAQFLQDENGVVYPVQQTQNGAVAYVEDLPSKGYKTFNLVNTEQAVSPFKLQGDLVLETPFYTVKLDEKGLFTSIFDKENHREVIQKDQTANVFRMYEDKPIYYDNWDIDIYYSEKYWDVESVTKMEWVELGMVRATLRIERQISNSTVQQDIHFYANKRRIDFNTKVDWKEHQHLLKVHFPLNIHTDEATFDIQFGNLTRKTHTNTSWDKARFETCGQKWVDLSEGHYGVSLLNDCKYGHSVKDSNLALTLIKSGIQPNPVTDQEMHYFSYALYPHNGGWREAGTVKEAYFFNQPVHTVAAGQVGKAYSLASVSAENAIIETIKQAEDADGYIVRIYECDNALTQAKLLWNKPLTKVEECNLIEEKVADIDIEADGFFFEIKPYEIKTFRIK